MSKSFDNYIGVAEPPDEMYGKTVSIPDESLNLWYSLLLGRSHDPSLEPWPAKRALARALVDRFHGDGAGEAAEREWDHVHREREAPAEMPEVVWPRDGEVVHLPALLKLAFGISTSEARRSIAHGGVKLDGEPVPDETLDVAADLLDGKVLQLGKRRFARVRLT
jgi:tyrosyl-tRNA synthetase